MNKRDLDEMFNMRLGHLERDQENSNYQAMDDTSKQYVAKIMELREKQKRLLPLFLQSQKVVTRHKKCLKVILQENEENIPYQLSRVIEKGQQGLDGYGQLLSNIQSVLVKNQYLVEQLGKYHSNIQSVTKKTKHVDMGIKQLNGDVSQQEVLMMKMAKQKDRINDLLSGMFTSINQ
uniref:Uncharacterized protein n=1 Tax=Strombidium rassoulzadegani TaxID=1082188 RepID=A0A7S3FY80_9SPIT|mmetsp:Transcript_5915/g.10088  ORF Transcript_5915/g.10088 Transcript_5915/m.10088 type:complete len:177 (+) Transcript_5915:1176-1706(+)